MKENITKHKHKWMTNTDDDYLDDFAFSDDFHNGYVCSACYKHFCKHCVGSSGVLDKLNEMSCPHNSGIDEHEYIYVKHHQNPIWEEITSKGSSNLNIEDLRSKIYIHEENYKKISDKLNKHKNALMKAHNTRVELETLLKDLDREIINEKTDLRKGLKSHTCPYCETELKDEESYYFHRVKHIDGYGVQRLTIEEQLAEINRTIELENNHYDKIQNEAKKIENEIFNALDIKPNKKYKAKELK